MKLEITYLVGGVAVGATTTFTSSAVITGVQNFSKATFGLESCPQNVKIRFKNLEVLTILDITGTFRHECFKKVPTVSIVGVVVIGALIFATGTAMLRRRHQGRR